MNLGLITILVYHFVCSTHWQISGYVQDVDGNMRYLLKGWWDQQYDVAKVTGGEGKNLETESYQTLWRHQEPE